MTAQDYTFQAEIQQLLNILVHSLYTDQEIFLRELISNASDALNRVQFESLQNDDVIDLQAELAIRITADQDAGTITIADTGIGMNADEMVHNLGTIAQSGAREFLAQMQAAQAQNIPATDLIGQFGVGFYSAFMVADKIEVLSRSFRPDDEAWLWTSDGSSTFTIEPAEKETRGTEITLYLNEDAEEFLEEYRLRSIVKKHSDFIAFPIYLGEDEESVNQQTALWRRSPRDVEDEEYASFYRQLTLDYREPSLHLHIQADAPIQFYSVLYAPQGADPGILNPRTDHGLKLYARKVLIQEYNKDFLPNYLRFVDGVVDSEDLPLNVARESIQTSRAIRRIGMSLKGKFLSELERLAEEEPDRYLAFWNEFGPFLKEGIATEPSDADRLAKLLRFHSTLSGGEQPTVSLADYVARMRDDQEHIYYILASDVHSVADSPHLDPFHARDIEVLYLTEAIDSFMIMNLHEFDGKPLQNVDDANLELPDLPEDEDEAADDKPDRLDEDTFDAVKEEFETVLGERILEVRESKVLRGNPVRLATPEGQLDRNVQRVYKMLDKDFDVPRKILELNPRHPLIHNLAQWINDDPSAPLIEHVIEQLFESALLMDGIHPNPADMVGRIEALMEAATRR